jgi:hypothetical protein
LPLAQKTEPSAELIDTLRRALISARKGEITGVAGIALFPDDTTQAQLVSSGNCKDHPTQVILMLYLMIAQMQISMSAPDSEKKQNP